MDNIKSQKFFCAISSQKNKNPYINLLQIGWDKCEPGYSYSNFRDMYIIHYVKCGKGILETNGIVYDIGPGDAFIVRPNILTIQTADKQNPWEYSFFAFKGDMSKFLIDKTLFKENVVKETLKDSSIFDTICDAAIQFNGNYFNEIHNLEYLFKLLSFFETEANSPNNNNNNNNNNNKERYVQVYTIKKYISLNFSKDIKISDVAKQHNINRSHLYRVFKEQTGKSIKEYLINTRMNEARRLLDDTDFSIASIASLVGYSHTTTFFKTFKSHIGITPTEYRARKNKLN